MTPSWIIDTHDKWVSAVDFDPAEEEEQHRLQPFSTSSEQDDLGQKMNREKERTVFDT
jgi:hypothetical protein